MVVDSSEPGHTLCSTARVASTQRASMRTEVSVVLEFCTVLTADQCACRERIGLHLCCGHAAARSHPDLCAAVCIRFVAATVGTRGGADARLCHAECVWRHPIGAAASGGDNRGTIGGFVDHCYHYCSTKTLWTEAPKLGPKKLTQAAAFTRWFYSIKRKQWHGQMAPVGILWQRGALPCHACGCPNASLCPDYPNCTTKLTAP